MAGTDRYDYDANGNVTKRDKGLSTQQTLTYTVESRLSALTASGLSESYLYDADGVRVKKVSNGVNTFYPFPHYEVEVNGSTTTVTKYYFFAGMRVAMKEGSGGLVYLNGDHLSSTALATTSTGAYLERQGYYGYGKYRTGGVLPTDNRYTGQKLDAATGLYYYGARYYDRNIGMFVSPDSLVPDPTNVWDYNCYGYARLNPLKYNDPTGHDPGACMALAGAPPIAVGCQIGTWLIDNGPLIVQLATQWADKVPALTDRLFNTSNAADQASHGASQNAGNSGAADPNGWDPNKLNHDFRDAGERYQYQTSGTLYGQETRLTVNVSGAQRTLDVDNIVNGYLRESKFVNEANSFYSKQIGGSTGMHLHVGGWRDELQRYVLASEQEGYKGVKLFTNSQEAIRVVQELFGKEEWFQKIELIYQAAK